MADSKEQYNSLWCVGSNDGMFGVGNKYPIKTLNKYAKAEWSLNRGKMVNKIIKCRGAVVFQKNNQEFYFPSDQRTDIEDFNANSFAYFKDNQIDIVNCSLHGIFISREQDIYVGAGCTEGVFKMSYFRKKKMRIRQVELFDHEIIVVICETGNTYWGYMDLTSCESIADAEKRFENFTFKQAFKNYSMKQVCSHGTEGRFTDEGVFFIDSEVGNIYISKDFKTIKKLSIPFLDDNHIKVLSVAATDRGETLLVRGIQTNSKTNSEKPKAYILLKNGRKYEKIDCNLSSINDVTYVSCGDNHYLLKTSDGTYYILGDNEYGQCLLDGEDIIRHPRAVNDFIKNKLKNNDPRDILQVEVCGNNTFILIGDIQENKEPEVNFIKVDMSHGEYSWKLSDSKLKSAKNGAVFKSDAFSCHGMQWYLTLYPNGHTKSKRGKVVIFCNLKSKPSNIESVKIYYKLKIPKIGFNQQQRAEFDEKSSSDGCSNKTFIPYNKLTVDFQSKLISVRDKAGKDCTGIFIGSIFESVEDDGVEVGQNVQITDSYQKLKEEWGKAELGSGYNLRNLLGEIGIIEKIEEDDDTVKVKWKGGKRWIPIRACFKC
eukprot:138097_1